MRNYSREETIRGNMVLENEVFGFMRHIIKQDQPILSYQFCKDPKLFLLKNYKTTGKFYSTEFQIANFAKLPNGPFILRPFF